MKPLQPTLILLGAALVGGPFLWWHERAAPLAPGTVTLLLAPQEQIRRVVLRPSGLVMARDGKGWMVSDPKTGLSAPLDAEAGRALWPQIGAVRSNLAVENPGKLAQYGLQKPRASVEVDGRRLEFGSRAPFDKKLIYARGDGQIALVKAELAAPTRVALSGWRDRTLVAGDVEAASRWTLRREGSRLEFEKIGGDWTVRQVVGAAKTGGPRVAADPENIVGALRDLAQARTSRWLDERGQNAARFGLNAPPLKFESGGSRLEIGGRTEGGFAGWRGAGAIFEVPASLQATLNRRFLDWRDHAVTRFEVQNVARLEVAAAGEQQVFVKNAASWTRVGGDSETRLFGVDGAQNSAAGGPQSASDAEVGDAEVRDESNAKTDAAVLDLLDLVRSARAVNFFAAAPASRTRFGLAAPVLKCKALNAAGDVIFDLSFGRVASRVYVENWGASPAASGTILEMESPALDDFKRVRSEIWGSKEEKYAE